MISEPEHAPPELDVQEALTELATVLQHPVICLCGDMDDRSVSKVREYANGLKKSNKLSVLLHSPGGNIDDAYRIILALREHAEKLDVLVPDWAKSAATFFCLAADNILMGRYGELGPLDPQRLDRRGSVVRSSALESFKALEQLLQYSLDSLDGMVLHLLDSAPLDIPYAIEHAQPLFSAIVSPLYSKVDLHELGEAGRDLSISEEYAVRALKRWGQPQSTDDERRRIARRLVWDYPTHAFVIDLREAREIGLNASELDEETDLLCRNIATTCEDYVGIGFPKSEVHPTADECQKSKDEGLYNEQTKLEETTEENHIERQTSDA